MSEQIATPVDWPLLISGCRLWELDNPYLKDIGFLLIAIALQPELSEIFTELRGVPWTFHLQTMLEG